MLRLAAASGCIALLIGFETLSEANIAKLGKKSNIVDEYETVIRRIHSHGIAVDGLFMLGLDEDDEGVFEHTIQFTQRMNLECAQFAWPIPYPCTAFYESLDKAGRIVIKDWSQYGYNIVFEPKLMSREVLQQQHARVWGEFYSLPSIWGRVGMARRNLSYLWALNLYYRSFWHKKLKADRHTLSSALKC